MNWLTVCHLSAVITRLCSHFKGQNHLNNRNRFFSLSFWLRCFGFLEHFFFFFFLILWQRFITVFNLYNDTPPPSTSSTIKPIHRDEMILFCHCHYDYAVECWHYDGYIISKSSTFFVCWIWFNYIVRFCGAELRTDKVNDTNIVKLVKAIWITNNQYFLFRLDSNYWMSVYLSYVRYMFNKTCWIIYFYSHTEFILIKFISLNFLRIVSATSWLQNKIEFKTIK